MINIIGIDPGLLNMGWSVIHDYGNRSGCKFIHAGTITTNSSESLEERLFIMHDAIGCVIKDFAPTDAAIEFSYVNNNKHTSLKLAHAVGSILLSLRIHEINVFYYTPTQVKKIVAGNGNAMKEQVAQMLNPFVSNLNCKNLHEYDATAIALSRFFESKQNTILQKLR
ncbi:hypothetical protein GUI12_03520 [Anaplasmataceae bacterium AB001_6]|nr:hypothetical protein GUI12_03520 [Anaplasmataceae bacterium AB001_6]